jgi:hypothetical protein
MERIYVIRKSQNIFAWGLIGLIPIVGFVPAVYAMLAGIRLHLQSRREWNPAAKYLSWGTVLGSLSVGITLLVAAIVILGLLPPYGTD